VLQRVRFTTKDPIKLAQELDRFVIAVQDELRRVERQSARRLTLAEIANGPPGGGTVVAAFDTILPVNSAQGDVDVLMPAATRADASRMFLVARLSTSNVVRLQGGQRLINNNTPTVTLPSGRAVYAVWWDGLGFWTENDAT
jgi:hypothetical protein